MTSCNSTRPPSYCLHKASGQAVVTIDRKDRYLGVHGTSESRLRYDQLILPDPSYSLLATSIPTGVRTRSGLSYPQTPKFFVH